MRARLELTWQESLFSATVTAITLIGTALVLGVGGLHVLNGRLTVGSLLVVVAYLAAVYTPISEIARTTAALQQAIVSAKRVRNILALTPERPDAPGSINANAIIGHIRFSNVLFSYDDKHLVLDGVSFDARPGEVIALVGPTGAGKTTVANLIPRLFDVHSGQVLLDDVDVAQYSLRSLRNQIALVPQHPILFAGTIADNIRYGRLDASHDEVVAAARSAHAHDFVVKLSQGYHTDMAEAGVSLSGGERQRIGIARALLKDAPVLILDEPTSALDAISEAAIFEALRKRRSGHTTLVIAHRLSTIRDATRIVVLDAGQVIAEGTHDELMASNELYREMCARLTIGRSPSEGVPVDAPLPDHSTS
jgi:ABC-type multidrug transport system fused ATPase/permease subunit